MLLVVFMTVSSCDFTIALPFNTKHVHFALCNAAMPFSPMEPWVNTLPLISRLLQFVNCSGFSVFSALIKAQWFNYKRLLKAFNVFMLPSFSLQYKISNICNVSE